MAKIIGAVFTILGGLGTLFIGFLILNSSVVLSYLPEDGNLTMSETPYILPGLLALFLLITGIVFLSASKEEKFI